MLGGSLARYEVKQNQEPLVSMVNIVKRFPGVVANDHVNFDLMPGEIHALLGENGAGKTTLMNILYGIYKPDEGEIYVRGRKVKIRSPKDAMRLGIGMVHQHFLLVDRHTVAENLALGHSKSLINPLDEIKAKIREFAEKYGLKVDPDSYIWQLSAGEQQKVEIIKALYRGANILVLDEPTSILTPQESRELFSILKRMKEDGNGIIFITHKLAEVFEVADRVTVMRKGRVVGTLRTQETSKEELAKMMVGREVIFTIKKRPAKMGGLRKVKSGTIRVMGIDVTNKSPREIAELGVGHIPEERLKYGIVPNLSVAENFILKSYYKPPLKKGFVLDYSKIEKIAEKLIEEYGIVAPTPNTPARLLSGGNMQKLIVARELWRKPKLIVALNPTFGLDVGATEYIRKILLEQRDEGAAILLLSGDLDEILQMSDRLAVMYNGQIMGIVRPGEVSVEEIGLMMSGISPKEVVL